MSIERFAPGRAESAAVVQFVRQRSRAPRVCVAATGERSLGLALAFGELPEAEVILIRPAALARRSEPTASSSGDGVAVAQVGDRFECRGFRFEIVDMDRNRVDKLLVTRMAPDGPATPASAPG